MAAKKVVKHREEHCAMCGTKIVNLTELNFYTRYTCGKCKKNFYVVRYKKDYNFE